ncbi:MarR family transcriptional regulator [Virgibacillus alimentarius]|uniref:MarR family transcriptional regulator n=1 Tax=Virgibacillus alimentarius TaxID=698769 RepID=UPI000493B03B|nr:MarR family transcriptional regulator [Virgibacillus alimentarius]
MESLPKERTLKAIENFILQREKNEKQQNDVAESLLIHHGFSEGKLSLTQLHIVALINEQPSESNNTFLANQLGISKPAVTKAINALMEKGIVTSQKKESNQKAVFYSLTNTGKDLVLIHEQMHQKAREKYEQLLNQFTDDELQLITKFLNKWSEQL